MTTRAPQQIEDIDGEALVNEVAKCGIRKGLYIYDKPANRCLANLGFDPYSREGRATARSAMSELRWYAEHGFKEWPSLIGRLERVDTALHLTSKEWSKRLAGKTSEEIETLLNGDS